MTKDTPAGPFSVRRGASLIAAGILLSRFAGLLRERVIATYLGVGVAVDAFRAALRIPNLLQNLLGEGVLSASFIPVYVRLLADGEEEEAGRVAGAVAGLLAVLAGLLAVLGTVLARPLTLLLAPGFSGPRLDLTVTLTRILFPGVGVLVLSAWCLGVLNSHRRFFLSYVAPVLWNLAQITAVVTLATRGAARVSLAEGLAWGATAGGLLQLALQLPTVRAVARPLYLSVRTDLAGVRTALRRFWPVVAGRGVVQLSAYVDLLLASLLAVGAVSALGYAQVFYLLPISLFGMSVAAAELPELSRLDVGGQEPAAAWQERLEDGLARIAFFVVPISVTYVVLGDLVVAALLESGRFGAADTRLVWYVLAAFTVGLLATTSSRLLQSALYALGDTRTPARAAALRVVIAGVGGAILMVQLDRVVLTGPGLEGLSGLSALPASLSLLPEAVRTAGPLRLGAAGLALASGASAWTELVLLRRRLKSTVGRVRMAGGQLQPLLIAAGILAAAAVAARPALVSVPSLLAMALAVVPLGLLYLGVSHWLGVPEAVHLVAAARRRARRAPPP